MSIEQENPDTKRLITVKPRDFKFIPGHSIQVSIPRPGFESMKRDLTFTSLNSDYYLEFIFKEYPRHDRFNEALSSLRGGDEIIISDMTGLIEYKGNGVFIASGNGVIPFISIFRQLRQDEKINGNVLIYQDKSKEDLILERELRHIFGRNSFFLLTREPRTGYDARRLDENYIKGIVSDFNQEFYVCGQESFINEVKVILEKFGATSINAEIVE